MEVRLYEARWKFCDEIHVRLIFSVDNKAEKAMQNIWISWRSRFKVNDYFKEPILNMHL